jgi:hypothetical protein
VALEIDIDRRIVGPRARKGLVEAILSAEPHEPETFWLEWKSAVNLGEKKWRGEIASHILGFANRDPRVAIKATEGQGYIAFGVSPGCLEGVEVADPAELEDWLSPYLGGAEGPHWDADYVTVDGKQVLLVSVEPPRQGDSIRTLRRAFTDPSGTTHHEGRVFVRRYGKSVPQPSSAEMQMLQRRLVAEKNHLGLEFQIESGSPLQALDLSEETRKRWILIQEEEMLESLKGQGGAALFSSRRLIGDGRTPDGYREEVESCLRQASKVFPDMARARAIGRGLNRVEFAVINQTEDNFHQVLVELHVKGEVRAFFSEEEASSMVDIPERPRPYGTPPPVRLPLPNPFPESSRLLNTGRIEDMDSLRMIQFPVIDLRPGYKNSLVQIYLFPDSSMVGSEVEVYWHSTSTTASGSASGMIHLPVSDEIVQLEDLQGAL